MQTLVANAAIPNTVILNSDGSIAYRHCWYWYYSDNWTRISNLHELPNIQYKIYKPFKMSTSVISVC